MPRKPQVESVVVEEEEEFGETQPGANTLESVDLLESAVEDQRKVIFILFLRVL